MRKDPILDTPTHNISNVESEDLPTIDFRKCSLPIGVRLENRADDQQWLALSEADLRILHCILTSHVRTAGFMGIATEDSPQLEKLAGFAMTAATWMMKNDIKSRPDGE